MAYVKYSKNVSPFEFSLFEKVLTSEEINKFSKSSIKSPINYKNMFTNTLKIISDNKINKDKLNQLVSARNSGSSSGQNSPNRQNKVSEVLNICKNTEYSKTNSETQNYNTPKTTVKSRKRSDSVESTEDNDTTEIDKSSKNLNEEMIQIGNESFVTKETLLLSLNSDVFSDLSAHSPEESDHSITTQTFDFSINSSDSTDSFNPRIKEFRHLILPKEEISADCLFDSNLQGKLVINNSNIPDDCNERIIESKFAVYRKLFKIIGKLMRKLNFADQGQTNSEILMDKLQINETDNDEIKKQGRILLDIIKSNVYNTKVTYESLKKDLEPIFQWYKTNYHLDPDKMQITELVINEGFGMHVNFSHTAPEDFYLPNDFDYKNVFDNDSFFRDDFLDDDFLPKEESSSSSSSSYSYDEDIQIDENNSVDLVLNLDDS